MRLSPLPELKPHSQISIAFLAHYVGGDAELELFLQHMRDFARERLAPFAAQWDRECTFPREALKEKRWNARLRRKNFCRF